MAAALSCGNCWLFFTVQAYGRRCRNPSSGGLIQQVAGGGGSSALNMSGR